MSGGVWWAVVHATGRQNAAGGGGVVVAQVCV